MKNPSTAKRAGVLQVTLPATVASTGNATEGLFPARRNERRYVWSRVSNSVEYVTIRKGRIDHG